ncbi:MAG TPA: PPE domain-containing protein [Mycobacterium sp.]|nr:PPE domain-containing protein [Mycobacterium sp.]
MTAPLWLAVPPEVHSALLSSGPGPGPLLAAAGAWSSLSAEYATVADELSAVLGMTRAGAWDGFAAESYLGAHLPYLAWLLQAAADSTRIAAKHETVAAAYGTALAAMPTLAELAANHATHAVLAATNFFGINTIPIALNEADYVRMWIQAATTMAGYQSVSTAVLAGAPHPAPAPAIVKSASAQDPPSSPGDPLNLSSVLAQLENFEGANNVFQLIWPGNAFTSYPPGTDLGTALGDIWTSFTQGVFFYDPQTLAFAHNPTQLFFVVGLAAVQLITHRIFDLTQLVYNFPQLLTAVIPLLTAPVPAASGLAGLAGLAGLPSPAALPAPAAPVPAAEHPPPMVIAPAGPAGTAPGIAGAAAPAAPAAAPPPGAAPPPPVTGVTALSYLVGGAGPDINFGSGMATGAKGSAAESAAAAAATREQQPVHRRRRQQVGLRGHGNEYMAMNIQVEPDWAERFPAAAAADRGAGAPGFTGTARRDARAGGLTILTGDALGSGPAVPMLPETWGDTEPE